MVEDDGFLGGGRVGLDATRFTLAPDVPELAFAVRANGRGCQDGEPLPTAKLALAKVAIFLICAHLRKVCLYFPSKVNSTLH